MLKKQVRWIFNLYHSISHSATNDYLAASYDENFEKQFSVGVEGYITDNWTVHP